MVIKVQYKGIKFEAIMATPGAGKSYLCDRNDGFLVHITVP